MEQQINNINNSNNNKIFSYKYNNNTNKKKKRTVVLHKESERSELRQEMEIIRGKRQNSTLGHYNMEMPSNPKIK